MEVAGWAAVAVGSIAGGVTVLGYLADQVPGLSAKMIKAVRAIRAVKDEVRRSKRP
ncbi:hypothetical protein AB0E75_20345 [Streptomyces griseoviridis]|uniref:Uncharacterized protein n=2 Tax=Streptomyces TaxID=1883 RepID=A0A918L777_STRGD|nr:MULTISPECIES: hypothetical protein [Streptomyces]GGS16714.1 hypothetical protein GCM10010238_00680 [Streptomyces niveoruber]GGU35140.1 hypothetical protein GCM10010259_27060 [Streptomyces daghestanicus]GHI33973.1 hypothetical protein Sdagh_57030 [Streptomyces daghestanicus]